MKKILVVGQTPPPHGGQAIMINDMLKAKFKFVKLYHVRMSFSSDMEEVGKFKTGKVVKLISLIIKIFYYRFRYQIKTLYYPPAPPLKVPMLRDLVILNAVRWLFTTTIFHFHAAGISEMHKELKGLLKKLFERAYFYPEVCIRLSEFNPEDGKNLYCKRECIVPNGLNDFAASYLNRIREEKAPTILSVGVLCESKGVMVLLESVAILARRKQVFKVQFMGRFESYLFKKQVFQFIEQQGLKSYIEFLGVQTGEAKALTFSKADIFCFPTFFEAETFGLVALEAMQFCLPVVATNWRGVPSVVKNEESGFIVPIKNPSAMADKLEILLNEPGLRKQMGEKGRELYFEKFTSEKHYEQLENAFTLGYPL